MILTKHLTEKLPNPQDIRPEIPDSVVHVIQRMMAKEPADRYQDCEELLDDLELILDGAEPLSAELDPQLSSILPRSNVLTAIEPAAAPQPEEPSTPSFRLPRMFYALREPQRCSRRSSQSRSRARARQHRWPRLRFRPLRKLDRLRKYCPRNRLRQQLRLKKQRRQRRLLLNPSRL